jgi:hypothetical protein
MNLSWKKWSDPGRDCCRWNVISLRVWIDQGGGVDEIDKFVEVVVGLRWPLMSWVIISLRVG